MKTPKPSLPKYLVALDWKAYYLSFVREHNDPVVWRGVQLFRDGWTYSTTDYQGPEWPPPSDRLELLRMQRAYWLLRKREVRKAHFEHEQLLKSLELASATKSLPLRKKVIRKAEDGRMRQLLGEEDIVDTKPLKVTIDLIEIDLLECDANLKEIDRCILESTANSTLSPQVSSRMSLRQSLPT